MSLTILKKAIFTFSWWRLYKLTKDNLDNLFNGHVIVLTLCISARIEMLSLSYCVFLLTLLFVISLYPTYIFVFRQSWKYIVNLEFASWH